MLEMVVSIHHARQITSIKFGKLAGRAGNLDEASPELFS
jgi:hypothetical protein